MNALARAGWRTVTLADFTAPRTTHDAPRTFLLTFDDGYASLAEYAYPILGDLGFTATTFLITDYVGKMNTWDVRYTWKRLGHLSWADVEHWRARGFEFGSHGATHRRLTWLDDPAVEAELHGSRTVLMARLGPEAGHAIVYPFGALDDRVVRHTRQAGYALGFGGVKGNGDPLQLPRVPVYCGVLLGPGRCPVRSARRCPRRAWENGCTRGESVCGGNVFDAGHRSSVIGCY